MSGSDTDESIIFQSPNFAKHNADDICLLVEQDYSYLSIFEQIHQMKQKRHKFAVGYYQNRLEETVAIRIPTKLLQAISAKLPYAVESLKEKQAVLLHASEHKQGFEVREIDAGIIEVPQVAHGVSLHLDFEKTEYYVNETIVINGQLCDSVTGKGIADEVVWIALDEQPKGIVKTDQAGRLKWEYVIGVEGSHVFHAVARNPPNASAKLAIEIEKLG